MTDLPATVYRPDWVSPKEAAEYLGISRDMIRRLRREGKLVSIELGYRTIRISMTSVEKMMERNRSDSVGAS